MNNDTQFTTPESVLNPCPSCGRSRESLDADCDHCTWSVDRSPHTPALESGVYGKSFAMTIGVLTFLPLAYGIWLNVFVFAIFFTEHFPTSESIFQWLMLIHIVNVAFVFGLLVFYIVFLFKTDQVRSDKKALWAVVLFLANVIAMLVFWYIYIWKPAKRAAD